MDGKIVADDSDYSMQAELLTNITRATRRSLLSTCRYSWRRPLAIRGAGAAVDTTDVKDEI